MKEIHYYVADDGTKFNEEKECFNYEFNQKIKGIVNTDLKMFDENYEKITNYTYDSISEAYAIQVLTIKGAEFLVNWADEWGIETPFDSWDIKNKDEDLLGTWVYDALDYGGWTHLDKLKRKVDELYFSLQK